MANKLVFPRMVIDTREQAPLDFGADVLTVRRKLDSGDYSLEGFERMVAVERKNWTDAWSSMSTGRARFERCIGRLAKLDRAAIVIECTLAGLCERPHQIQRTQASSVVGGLISYSAQYAIPVFFCGTREFAARVTLRYLASWFKHRRLLVDK